MAPRIPAFRLALAEGIAGGNENTFRHAPASKLRIQPRRAAPDARRKRPRKITGSAIGPKKLFCALHRNCINMPLR
jgi:hypothetical protein